MVVLVLAVSRDSASTGVEVHHLLRLLRLHPAVLVLLRLPLLLLRVSRTRRRESKASD